MAEREAFDELWGMSGGAEPRPGFEPLAEWLADTSEAELDRRQEAAEVAFRNLGITFNVYGEEDAGERIIPFDIVPRIFTAVEWDGLSAGLEQRVRALNDFIGDIYGERRILADGVVPAEIVLTNPQFCAAVAGARPPHGIYAHICGIDLVRTGADQFYVLEDNARTPSGVSYMIENREAMLRLCPELFDRYPVRPIDNYPDLLRETLHSVAPHGATDPVAVLLTPGHFNSAFYEHSFLADQMGIELVEDRPGSRRRHRLDAHHRRPRPRRRHLSPRRRRLSRSPDVRSRLDARRTRPHGRLPRRQRRLVNAPGTGIADDKAIYSYMPEIVRYYSGEEARLPNVETWRCREPQALRYTLAHLSELVVKLVDGSGGYGMLVGPTASKAETEAFRAALIAEPHRYIAQPTLALSTVPTLTHKGFAPRHVDFRPFVLTGADGVSIVPGGLTRVALQEGSLVVNSSQGGGTKDSLILAATPEPEAQHALPYGF
jgi:uncharacterized circularly permuted ATP-grasp superfamily protein